MRIGFDAKRLFLNNTGLGNYSRTLVRNLVKYFPDHSYYLYSPRVEKNKENTFFFEQDNVKIITPQKGGGAAWRSRGVLKEIKKDGIDVFHGLSNELPYGISQLETKSVVTIHDVIFERYPKQYGIFDRLMYRSKTKNAIAQSDRVVSISNQTTEDLVKYYYAPLEKISLLYQTCNPSFTDKPSLLEQKENKYFLYVGSVIERKNLISILQAMDCIPKEQRQKLIIVGTGNSYYKRAKNYAEKNGLEPWLEWKGSMDNSGLRSLYENAIALIYPSIFEGFGIPVIESMFAGRPVITSNLSSLKEAGGEAAMLIDPFSVSELAAAMQTICDKDFQSSLLAKIPKHLEQFDPKNLSNQLIGIYESL